MSDYRRITDRKIELTDEGVEELMADYTPTTKEVRYNFATMEDEYATELNNAAFDRWLAEVIKAERERILANLWRETYESGFHDQEGNPGHSIEFYGKDGLYKIINGDQA